MKNSFHFIILFIGVILAQTYFAYSQPDKKERKFIFKSGVVFPEKRVIASYELENGFYNGMYHVLIETNHLETIKSLMALGVLLNDYIQNNAYMVQVPELLIEKVLKLLKLLEFI